MNNQTGNNNTAVGFYTLVDNQGSNNTALGAFAGNALTTGSDNIDIGHPGVAGESSTIRIGDGTTQTNTFLTGIIHGDGSGLTGITATSLVMDSVTSTQLASDLTLDGTTVFSGALSLPATTSASAGVIMQNGASLIHTFGNNNFFAGTNAGNFTMGGSRNTAIGIKALFSNALGERNAALGYQALYSNTLGDSNTGIGHEALYSNDFGTGNTAIGRDALHNNTAGVDNIALGIDAGLNLTTGNNNIDIGNRGVAGEDGIIRIGTTGAQTDTFLTGVIHGNGSGLTNLPGGGGGVTLVDGNNVTLGRVLTSNQFGATVLTSTGYQVTIPFDGVFQPAQLYYTGASCTGTAYLNDGGIGGGTAKISGKWVVFSGSFNSLMEPDTVANGTEVNSNFTAATIDNPTCGASAGARSGWKLKLITHTAAGLPNTIALPITMN